MAKGKKASRIALSQALGGQQDNEIYTALSEDAFSNIREKIQAKLQHQRPQVAANKKTQIKQSNGPTDQKTQSRGTKRKHDGTVLREKDSQRDKNASVHEANESTDDAELRDMVKELGGTDEDLALIADADSDSEIEGAEASTFQDSKPKDGKSLQQGMSNILKEIALAQGVHKEGSPDNSDDESEVHEKDEIQSTAKTRENVEQKIAHQETRKEEEEGRRKRTGRERFKCEPRPDWYTTLSEVDLSKEPQQKLSLQNIQPLHIFAQELLDTENETFKSTQQTSSSQAFYNTVIASGTLSDRISALTLAVQESPLHNIRALDVLIGLAGKRSRAQAIEVLRALKDLFAQGSLLPSERRLYNFSSHPLIVSAMTRAKSWKKGDRLPHGIDEPDLIRSAFEDWLKGKYFEVLRTLEVWCNDEIEFSRSRAVSFVYELLKEKPEQESNLLRLLVNKLGDPVKRIASQTSYLLMQLLISHPAMKMVVISFVESDFLFRPGQSIHGQYYAITTLNQTALSSREEDVANKLLDIYFSLFASLLKSSSSLKDKSADTPPEVMSTSRAQRQRRKASKGPRNTNSQTEELSEKLIAAVLTGVNRAYPYAGADQKNFDKHLDTLFQITHSANFNTGVQAMMLIQQLTSTHGAAADRFHRTLYESLLDPRLISASKQQLYLNLLHRSLKADLNVKRVKAFAKRIVQILSLHDPSFICGAFFLLKDLEGAFPSFSALLNQPELQNDDDEEEAFYDVDEDTGLPDSRALKTVGQTKFSSYDGNKRAPEHAKADNSCIWEMLPFLAHFHPSVSVTTEHYLQQQTKLPGKPDLSLHTLIHFLDRFVYRNPKLAINKLRGASIMQPMANNDTHAVLISSGATVSAPAANTDAFKNQRDTDVAAEDVFFHRYFSALGKDAKTKRAKKVRDTDGEGIDDNEDEDAVWKAMMDSAPDLEGASSDEDLAMSSMEEDSNADVYADGISNADEDDASVDIEDGIFDDDVESDEDSVSVTGQSQASEGSQDMNDSTAFEASKDDSRKTASERKKGKKIKSLPTFASAADYAKMIENDDDEDLG